VLCYFLYGIAKCDTIKTAFYHFGASLKDLEKKWFAFSKMAVGTAKIIKKVKELV